jgi:hypothetical protein
MLDNFLKHAEGFIDERKKGSTIEGGIKYKKIPLLKGI